MWTSHGHQIIGTIALDPVSNNRPRVARCGGPSMGCQMCLAEARQAQKEAGRDEFGNKTGDQSTPDPLPQAVNEAYANLTELDDTASPGRMLGRVRMGLLAIRPMSEVDLICERFAQVLAEHKVLMEHYKLNPEALGDIPKEHSDEKTMVKVRDAILKGTRASRESSIVDADAWADEIITELQSAGILFREAMVTNER